MSEIPPSQKTGWRRITSALGPGLITGAADDDPAGIATYSIAGARQGLQLLWTAVFTWPLMAAVQMMCARIGMVTGLGLSDALRSKVPRFVLVAFSIALVFANTLNVGADLSAMADAAEMLTGWSSHIFAPLFGAVIAWSTVRFRYAQISAVLKWLALALLAYVITAFLAKPDWSAVFRAVVLPKLPQSSETWATLVAILGTTISPYLFYWQSSLEVEEEKCAGRKSLSTRQGATSREIGDRALDVGAGTFASNAVMFFIILTTALTLNRDGKTEIETSREVAEALRPLAGNAAYLLYAIGVLGVGFLAIPTLAGSAAYACAETFGWRQGLDKPFRLAPLFYGVVIASIVVGIGLDLAKVNAVKALFASAVINGLVAPFMLVGILLVAGDAKLMRGQPSSKLALAVVGFTTAALVAAAIAMFVF